MLPGCYFIMLCLGRNSKFPEFLVDIFHKATDPLADNAKVMVIQLLSFRRHCSEQRSSGKDQVFSLQIFLMIYNEILLFHTDRREYFP